MRRQFAAIKKHPKSLIFLTIFLLWLMAPESPAIPVQGATASSWNKDTFWYAPWGRSGVHKGIDIFASIGTPVIAPTYGLVLFRGEISMGGKVVAVLGPKWRIHYFAHLSDIDVYPGMPVRSGTLLGRVGDTGNARGKPPHLHYSIVTAIPYPWLIDDSEQGWKKMFYLDPGKILVPR